MVVVEVPSPRNMVEIAVVVRRTTDLTADATVTVGVVAVVVQVVLELLGSPQLVVLV